MCVYRCCFVRIDQNICGAEQEEREIIDKISQHFQSVCTVGIRFRDFSSVCFWMRMQTCGKICVCVLVCMFLCLFERELFTIDVAICYRFTAWQLVWKVMRACIVYTMFCCCCCFHHWITRSNGNLHWILCETWVMIEMYMYMCMGAMQRVRLIQWQWISDVYIYTIHISKQSHEARERERERESRHESKSRHITIRYIVFRSETIEKEIVCECLYRYKKAEKKHTNTHWQQCIVASEQCVNQFENNKSNITKNRLKWTFRQTLTIEIIHVVYLLVEAATIVLPLPLWIPKNERRDRDREREKYHKQNNVCIVCQPENQPKHIRI